mmetsp:Transcript_86923/g.177028  ORF Transcript_86923/g.177028 Transcript_86923/m.177028 type:complete len:98 (+) Transcript_86923:2303-2596(+)
MCRIRSISVFVFAYNSEAMIGLSLESVENPGIWVKEESRDAVEASVQEVIFWSNFGCENDLRRWNCQNIISGTRLSTERHQPRMYWGSNRAIFFVVD